MGEEIKLEEKLAYLRALEGEQLEIDEAAVAKEYLKKEGDKSSLAIKILSVLGGFLASLAFLGFLMIAGLYDSEAGLLLFGASFIAGAILLNKEYDQLLIDTLSISIYLIGFALLTFGLDQVGMDENGIALLSMAISLGALLITQNYLLSFLSVLVFSGSLLVLILSNDVYNIIHLYVVILTILLSYHFLNEAKIISSHKILSRLYDPLRIGLIISLLVGLVLIGKRDLVPVETHYIWISSLVMIPVVLYLISLVLNTLNVCALSDRLKVYLGSAIILVPIVFAPAIAGAIIILLLSFLVNYKTGIAIGVVALLYFISQFYYDLNLSLLVKSGILFSSGLLFLLFYFFTHKRLAANEKV